MPCNTNCICRSSKLQLVPALIEAGARVYIEKERKKRNYNLQLIVGKYLFSISPIIFWLLGWVEFLFGWIKWIFIFPFLFKSPDNLLIPLRLVFVHNIRIREVLVIMLFTRNQWLKVNLFLYILCLCQFELKNKLFFAHIDLHIPFVSQGLAES